MLLFSRNPDRKSVRRNLRFHCAVSTSARSASDEPIHTLRTLRNGLLRSARNDRGTFLFPRKDRLLEFRDPRSPPRQNFGKLIDQRRRRGVDMLAGMAEADHAPRAF